MSVTVIGHRGCPDRAPENTVAAFENAAPHVDWVEFDVRECGSGELVVFHDETTERLLGVEGRVAELSLAALGEHGVAGSDEPVATLSEVLAAVPNEVGCIVELKQTGIADRVAKRCRAVANDVLVSSFSTDALAEYAAVGDAPLAHPVMDDWETGLDRVLDAGCDAIHPQYELLVAQPDRVAAAHDHGLTVYAWTIRDPEPVDALRAAGVDGLIADDWAYVTAE